ncbi:hypothetical protein CICLE_v10010542mg, partial [Citrus x clementina]
YTILNNLPSSLYDVYYPYKNAYEIWVLFKKKYVVEDAGTQQYYIGDFLHYSMVEEKYVSDQIHEYHILVNNIKKEEIFLLEQFKDYIKSSKHKKKQVSLEDVIIHIRIKGKNIIKDVYDKAKEFRSNANLIENTP